MATMTQAQSATKWVLIKGPDKSTENASLVSTDTKETPWYESDALGALGKSLVHIGQKDFIGASDALSSYREGVQKKKEKEAKAKADAKKGTKFAGTNYRGADGSTLKFISEGENAGKYWDVGLQQTVTRDTHPDKFPVRPISSTPADNKAANEAYEKAENAVSGIRKIDDIAENIMGTGFSAEGFFGTAAEFIKGVLGTQGGVSVWKTKFKGFVTSEVVQNLPPGVASDKDVELVRSAFPNEQWDKSALLSWLAGYRKQMMYAEVYFTAKGEYITETGSQSGFRDDWNNDKEVLDALTAEITAFTFGQSPSTTPGVDRSTIPTVKTQAEYDALPAGSRYYDGTVTPKTGPWVKGG